MPYIIPTLLGTVPYLPFKHISHPIEIFLEDFPIHRIKSESLPLPHLMHCTNTVYLSLKNGMSGRSTLIHTKQGCVRIDDRKLQSIAQNNNFRIAHIDVPSDISAFIALLVHENAPKQVSTRFVNELDRRIVINDDDTNHNTLFKPFNEDYVDYLRECGDMLYMSVVVEHNYGVIDHVVSTLSEFEDGVLDIAYK
ncbi:hypothetical protein VCUG_02292 [Vavraia culicis subsp. floridensis]|uniref:Uncharacterized protein n=1 Tax=Vavraia culicis (isolate floridensis) TaxID=948595 RepID=L2GRC6_VAVCU|nr:uncharacterized protein VCUG_02292 [Vavraia culicis subsp. floridensis]ELA46211.1 hypothetical protein VCUG_02292 [Vavraia culicis subsp. floridensis]